MIRVLAFIDFANLFCQCRAVGRKPDLVALRELIANSCEGRFLVDTYVYAPLPQTNGDGVWRFHDFLRSQGFQVISKRAKLMPDGRSKCDLDLELALDALDLTAEIRPDVVVLVTGDGDFAPLSTRIRRKGVRVEVASMAASLANELRLSAQGVVDLSAWADKCDTTSPQAPALGSHAILEGEL